MNEMELRDIFERKLKGILNPVMPNAGFIKELQKKLSSKPEVSVEYPNYLIPLLMVSSGLVAGVVIILVLSRIFRLITIRKLENSH